MITITNQSKRYAGDNREPESFNTEILKCDKISLDSEKNFKILNSYGFSVIYISHGQILADGNILKSGDIIFNGKFTKAQITAKGASEFILLTFSLTKDSGLFACESQIIRSKYDLSEYFEKIYSLKYINDMLGGVKEAYLILILNSLNSSYLFSNSEQELFNRAYNYIENNIKQFITPTIVAEAMNCTVTHLNRIIRQHTSKSLGEFIAERRIIEIKQLCHFGFSNYEIAEKLSFPTTELLRKYFRYHAGINLKNYRMKKMH